MDKIVFIQESFPDNYICMFYGNREAGRVSKFWGDQGPFLYATVVCGGSVVHKCFPGKPDIQKVKDWMCTVYMLGKRR